MRKVKAVITIAATVSLILALISSIFFYQYVFRPFMEGPTKGLEGDRFCVVEETDVSGIWDTKKQINFTKPYVSNILMIYVTPGGHAPSHLHADKIKVRVHNGERWVYIGDVENIETSDVGRELPCMGIDSGDFIDKDNCGFYDGDYVLAVEAEAEQKPWCQVTMGLVVPPAFQVAKEFAELFLNEGDMISICAIDRLRVKLFYPCGYESTLISGNCSGVNGLGWNYIYPIDCSSVDQNLILNTTPCSMRDAQYATKEINLSRQLPFPGTPLIQVGARSGCAGVQTGCEIDTYLGKPDDSEGCYNYSKISWHKSHTIKNVDYTYIYSDPITISNYVNLNDSSPYYKRWCLRINSSDKCWVNSIDVQTYTK